MSALHFVPMCCTDLLMSNNFETAEQSSTQSSVGSSPHKSIAATSGTAAKVSRGILWSISSSDTGSSISFFIFCFSVLINKFCFKFLSSTPLGKPSPSTLICLRICLRLAFIASRVRCLLVPWCLLDILAVGGILMEMLMLAWFKLELGHCIGNTCLKSMIVWLPFYLLLMLFITSSWFLMWLLLFMLYII